MKQWEIASSIYTATAKLLWEYFKFHTCKVAMSRWIRTKNYGKEAQERGEAVARGSEERVWFTRQSEVVDTVAIAASGIALSHFYCAIPLFILYLTFTNRHVEAFSVYI